MPRPACQQYSTAQSHSHRRTGHSRPTYASLPTPPAHACSTRLRCLRNACHVSLLLQLRSTGGHGHVTPYMAAVGIRAAPAEGEAQPIMRNMSYCAGNRGQAHVAQHQQAPASTATRALMWVRLQQLLSSFGRVLLAAICGVCCVCVLRVCAARAACAVPGTLHAAWCCWVVSCLLYDLQRI